MLSKWKIRNIVYQFPKSWNKTEVLNWVNTNIKVCPNCGKIDVSMNHFKDCNPAVETIRQERISEYYK